MLDLPPRLLQWRPTGNRLHIVTFNIETLIGHGKQESLAHFVTKHKIDVLALQETKSTSSDERCVQGGKLLLSGIVPDDLDVFATHIGKAVFLSGSPQDDTHTTNYFKLLDFMIHNDFLLASTFHTRPASKTVSYREIASSCEASPTQPTNKDFACLVHILAPLNSLHNFTSSSTQSTWTLPWFHRHFPLSFRMHFDRFTKPPRKPPPKITPPRTKQDQLSFKQNFAETFSQLAGCPTHVLGFEPIPNATDAYTDGSCPNQYQVCVGNPAGWGFALH